MKREKTNSGDSWFYEENYPNSWNSFRDGVFLHQEAFT